MSGWGSRSRKGELRGRRERERRAVCRGADVEREQGTAQALGRGSVHCVLVLHVPSSALRCACSQVWPDQLRQVSARGGVGGVCQRKAGGSRQQGT